MLGFPTLVRALSAFTAVSGLALLMLAPTSAFAHGEVVTVEPSQASHGDLITVSGQGFPASQSLTVTVAGVRGTIVLGEVQAGADGTFTAQFTIPEVAAPGTYQLEVPGAEETVRVDFAVQEETGGPTAPPGETTLVFERGLGETLAIVIIAMVLATAGTVLVLSGRRRHPGPPRETPA